MSGFYNKGLEGLLSRVIPEAAVFFVVGVNEDYVFDSADENITAIPEDSVVLAAAELSNVTTVDGILKADNYKWERVTSAADDPNVRAVVIFLAWDSGAQTRLLAYIDSAEVGIPQVLTGVNITAKWNTSGILKI